MHIIDERKSPHRGVIISWRQSEFLIQSILQENGEFLTKPIVTIYSRPGCHLCEDAKAAILTDHSADDFDLREINIDDDAELAERYRCDIPVVFINDVKVFKYRVDAREFKRKLKRLGGYVRRRDR